MQTLGFMCVLVGAPLTFIGLAKAAELFYLEKANYRAGWGMSEAWYKAARKHGWLLEGVTENLLKAVVGGVILAIGIVYWEFSFLTERGQGVVLMFSGVAFFVGFFGRPAEDNYSLFFLTSQVIGTIGIMLYLFMFCYPIFV